LQELDKAGNHSLLDDLINRRIALCGREAVDLWGGCHINSNMTGHMDKQRDKKIQDGQ